MSSRSLRRLRRRKRLRRWRQPVIFVLFAIFFLLILPVAFPIAMALHSRDRHRLRAAARTAACPGCGQTLGTAALDLADQEWQRQMDDFRSTQPGLRLRMVRDLDAICHNCRTQLSFHPQSRRFSAIAVPVAPSVPPDCL